MTMLDLAVDEQPEPEHYVVSQRSIGRMHVVECRCGDTFTSGVIRHNPAGEARRRWRAHANRDIV